FEPYKDAKVELLGPKLLFIALNLGGMALGVWKLNSLGLLPTHTSDWVSSLAPAQAANFDHKRVGVVMAGGIHCHLNKGAVCCTLVTGYSLEILSGHPSEDDRSCSSAEVEYSGGGLNFS
ncbi:er membrane protein complex subunit 4-like protein, partial [Trifolium pratense]